MQWKGRSKREAIHLDCIFCQIVQRNAPAYIVYQTNIVTAFLDKYPVTYGHTLVIPNQHISRLNLVKEPVIGHHIMDALRNVSNLLIEAGICEDFSILQDNGYYAEQDIDHLHFHIIPRYKDDGIRWKLQTNDELAREENFMRVWERMRKTAGEK